MTNIVGFFVGFVFFAGLAYSVRRYPHNYESQLKVFIHSEEAINVVMSILFLGYTLFAGICSFLLIAELLSML